MDWDISSKDQAFARFSYINQRGNNEAPLGPVLDGGGGNGSLNVSGQQINFANNLLLSETHIFSPRLVNEFRIGYVYGHFGILNPGYNMDSAAALGIGGVPSGPDFPDNGGLPTITISGGGPIASFGAHAYRPEKETENEYQILDNVSWSLGNHSLRLGFSFQSIRSYTLEPPSSHPAYTYNGSLTGKPGTANTGSGIADFTTNNMSNGSIGPSSDPLRPRTGAAQRTPPLQRGLRPHPLRTPVRHDVRRISHGLSHGPLGRAPRPFRRSALVVHRYRRTGLRSQWAAVRLHSLLDGHW
jgi:hypothetical protein